MAPIATRRAGSDRRRGAKKRDCSDAPEAAPIEVTPAWSAAIEGYRRELETRQASPNTLRAYAHRPARARRPGPGRAGIADPADALLPAAARLRRRARRAAGSSASTVARKLAAARGLFDHMTRAGDRGPEPGRAAAEPALGVPPAARPRPRRGAGPARAASPPPRRWSRATGRCSSSPTPRACAARSSSRSTSARSTSSARPSACSARAARSGSCPLGEPAQRAVAAYLERARPALVAGAEEPALLRLQERPPPLALGRDPPARHAGSGRRRSPAASPRTRCGTPSRPTCSRAGRTCARSRSCSATRASRPRRSTPGWSRAGCATPTPAPIPVRDPATDFAGHSRSPVTGLRLAGRPGLTYEEGG